MSDTPAFLTGSHAYGTPTDKSDVDLVVCASQETIDRLMDLVGVPSDYGTGSGTLRIEDLNLILVSPELYEAWRRGTELLVAQAPVTRERAVEVISAFLKAAIDGK